MVNKLTKVRKIVHLGLLQRILLAIVLGIVLGLFVPQWFVRVFMTFNALFSQFLGFLIPLIIVGLVTPAIADIGKGAGKMLVAALLISYADTVVSALLGYGTGSVVFPHIITSASALPHFAKGAGVTPYFTLTIPPMLDVMTALVFAFLMGLGIAYGNLITLKDVFVQFKYIITKTIERALVPLLPLYIFGIFLNMAYTGEAARVVVVFAQVILVILVLHVVVLLYEFLLAGGFVRRNPLKLLLTMLPAYLTALGTSSSAATIPVTLNQTIKNGVDKSIASFTIPLCATVHLSGSAMKITTCALAISMLTGKSADFGLFFYFILMLAIMMVAAPGVPGGAIMAALAPLGSILGFGSEAQALMIALYITMDSFGTACNVTGDGAIALVMDKLFGKRKKCVA